MRPLNPDRIQVDLDRRFASPHFHDHVDPSVIGLEPAALVVVVITVDFEGDDLFSPSASNRFAFTRATGTLYQRQALVCASVLSPDTPAIGSEPGRPIARADLPASLGLSNLPASLSLPSYTRAREYSLGATPAGASRPQARGSGQRGCQQSDNTSLRNRPKRRPRHVSQKGLFCSTFPAVPRCAETADRRFQDGRSRLCSR